MRNKVFKGEVGYFRYRKKRLLIATISGFLLMFLFFFTGYLIYATARNLITILAVLVVLPTAKIYVQYMMLPWKNSGDKAFFDNIKEKYPCLDIYGEMLITGSEKRFEITYLAIDKNDNIVAFSMNQNSDEGLFKKAVVNFLNYYNFDAKVSLCTDISTFEKKLKKLSEDRQMPTEEQREHMELVFEKISIMSI